MPPDWPAFAPPLTHRDAGFADGRPRPNGQNGGQRFAVRLCTGTANLFRSLLRGLRSATTIVVVMIMDNIHRYQINGAYIYL